MTINYWKILQPLALATVIAVADILVAFIIYLLNPAISVFTTASNFLLLEFGVLLVLGGCLMARQPLKDKDRYDDDGTPTRAWRYAQNGQKILLTSVFVLVLSIAFVFLGFL